METGATAGWTQSMGASGDTLDANALPLSCAPGGPGISACGVSREDCCASLGVDGGFFYRTYDETSADGGLLVPSDGGPAGEADPATVSSFRLDKYAVTVGRFRQFVTAWNAGYFPPGGAGKHTHLNGGNGLVATAGGYEPGWLAGDDAQISPTDVNLACAPASSWSAVSSSQDDLPVNCVNWYEAYAFCIWDGGFLPSETEFEYAAAGGDEQREYPWGPAPPGMTNEYAIYGYYYTCASGACTGAAAQIAPVGSVSAGAGRWGQMDLAGNVWQWNLDWNEAYVPCSDCVDSTPLRVRGSRGGYFGGYEDYLLVSWRAPTGGSSPMRSGRPMSRRGSRRRVTVPSSRTNGIDWATAMTPGIESPSRIRSFRKSQVVRDPASDLRNAIGRTDAIVQASWLLVAALPARRARTQVNTAACSHINL